MKRWFAALALVPLLTLGAASSPAHAPGSRSGTVTIAAGRTCSESFDWAVYPNNHTGVRPYPYVQMDWEQNSCGWLLQPWVQCTYMLASYWIYGGPVENLEVKANSWCDFNTPVLKTAAYEYSSNEGYDWSPLIILCDNGCQ